MKTTSSTWCVGAAVISLALLACMVPTVSLAARGGGGGGGSGHGGGGGSFHGGGGGGGGESSRGGVSFSGSGGSFSGGSRQGGGNVSGGSSKVQFNHNSGNDNRNGGASGNWQGGDWKDSGWKGGKGNGNDNGHAGNWNGNHNGDWHNNGNWNGNWHGNGNWNYGWGWGGGVYVYAPLWYPFGGGYCYNDSGYPYDTHAYDAPVRYQAQYAAPAEQPVEQLAEPTAARSSEFGEQAMQAFAAGDYRGAARLAQHAVVDNSQGAKPREVLSLALFAMGQYRGAAIEAHYALNYGPAADWPTLYHYYDDIGRYTKQVEDLAAYVREHRDSPEAQFLLAYHNLMMGHKQKAADGFAKVLALAPKDDIAQKMLTQLGGTAPAVATPPPPLGDKSPEKAATPVSAQKPATEPSDTPPPLPKAEAAR